MTRIRPEDFEGLDRAEDAKGMLGYLDSVSELAAVQAYKNQSFDLLEIQQGQMVLDVGCGTGDDARALVARTGPAGRIVGVDSSEVAIEEAIERTAGSSSAIEFRVGDALSLEFSNDEFDGTRADRLLQHLEGPARALRELIRVTRPGGKVVVFDADWDALVVDSPDLAMTRQIVHCGSDRVRSGCVGRQLRAMFLDTGLAEIEVRPIVGILTSFPIAAKVFWLTAATESAVQTGTITTAQGNGWLEQLRGADQAGRFFASLTCYLVAGRKPAI